MSEAELIEEAKEENPSEPLPDVPTAAEPGQPADSEEASAAPQVSWSHVSQNPSTTRALSIEEIEEKNAMVHRAESLTGDKLFETKFTQTFFKFMKNLSDKRCVEIFNMTIDYGDRSVRFYQKSAEFIHDVTSES